ncbi:putative GH3 family protein [Dioscorea sansibarensis]
MISMVSSMATTTTTALDDVVSRFEEATRDAQRLQLQTLRAILERNATVDYLQRHLSGGSLGGGDEAVSSFRRLIPLSSYDDYADLIQRIADGSESPSALSLDPLLCFFYSSGTSTMSPKMIPFFESIPAKASSNLASQSSSALLQRLFPPRQSINKVLWFLYAGKIIATKGGFRAMAATAFPFQNKRSSSTPLLSMCVSPPAVVLGSDNYQQMYCHLLCGLCCSASIDAIRAPYAVGLIRAIHLLESKWEQLCNDIEFGFVSSDFITDSSMREAVEELLGGPRPEIAMAIRGFFGKGKWEGVLRELWPEARYISCVTTGSMEQYYPKLRYYAGGIPILCGDYFSSECSVGININRLSPPESTSFVIIPTAAYFEFLPFRAETLLETNETVDISGVEIGELYEIVVTTYRGLYRYRLGDVVKVIGFYNSSPEVKFITRAPKDSSEIFTECDLMLAMENFQLTLNENEMGEVVDYAGYLDLDSKQQHLVVFIEIINSCKDWINCDCFKECCHLIEGCLGSVYKVRRAGGSLGCLEIAIVRPGSFEGLAMVAMENGAPANQYKPPKIIRNLKLVSLLRDCVISSYCY